MNSQARERDYAYAQPQPGKPATAPAAGLSAAEAEAKLEELLRRVTAEPPVATPALPVVDTRPAPAPFPAGVHTSSAGKSAGAAAHAAQGITAGNAESDRAEWFPQEPTTLESAKISCSDVETMVLKTLFSRGALSGRDISTQIRLPFRLVEPILRQMKQDQLLIYRNSAAMGDYEYEVTDSGRERARRLVAQCTYFGAFPVALSEYTASVAAQSLTKQHPTVDEVKAAFHDLLINERMLQRLGPAINSGRGLFLFGGPGNGKTSIAERITRCFGQTIWIPRALGVEGEIIRFFDPGLHDIEPISPSAGLLKEQHIDERWIRIRRPTIVVGGELTMPMLEVSYSETTGISEGPVQLKSNCGTLVIDDFGRQRMAPAELLNRWIVPLEKRYDYLNLFSGKKIQVPFDQLVVFSTNLEPRDLVDDAFLRRIPYKIEVQNPTEAEFTRLFEGMARSMNIPYGPDALKYLLETHYKPVNRPMRCCHPRDLLLQIRNRCLFLKRSPEMTPENLDFAVDTYFSVT